MMELDAAFRPTTRHGGSIAISGAVALISNFILEGARRHARRIGWQAHGLWILARRDGETLKMQRADREVCPQSSF
jgi:hypothetical protein